MTDVFNDSYAGTYDEVYAEKDYAAECQAIETLIAKFGSGQFRTLLDLHGISYDERYLWA